MTFKMEDGSEIVPTEEQNKIVHTALSSPTKPISIQAGAGASKTTTLLMIATQMAELGYKGAYTAFNKLIVEDAKKKFQFCNVKVGTIHSFAYRATPKEFISRLNQRPKMPKPRVSGFLRIQEIKIALQSGQDTVYEKLPKMEVLKLVEETIQNFCNSRDTEIRAFHTPLTRKLGRKPEHVLRDMKTQYQDEVVSHAKKLWKDITNENGVTPFWHHHYLKMWEMGNPLIDAHYIMIDEGQDLNPVMLSIVEKNAAAGRKIIIVGDSQQSIYSFTGAVDALAYVSKRGVQEKFLTKSFRFGEKIANVANMFLEDLDAELRLIGGNKYEGEVRYLDPLKENVNAILTRTNAGGIEAYMALQNSGKKVGLMVDVTSIKEIINGIEDMREGKKTKQYDLMSYRDFEELVKDIENDAADRQIAMLFRAIQEHGSDKILQALDNMPADSDILIVTAHKSKGREWDKVKIYSDFALSDSNVASATELPLEYLRLCYVAVTRAKRVLDWGALSSYRDQLDQIRGRIVAKQDKHAQRDLNRFMNESKVDKLMKGMGIDEC